MRVYLVAMDESEEAAKALRFASRRAQAPVGTVHILALVTRKTSTLSAGCRPPSSKRRATVPKRWRGRSGQLV